MFVFFFKQKTAYEMRISDWSSDVCSSDLVAQFDEERARFEIKHLKIGLARKSGQTNAEFEVNPQTTLTKITSQILSEGEQRALALAGFLTEVALTEGSGPIIVDDPVSSLDRDRSAKVADRIAAEDKNRQGGACKIRSAS